jgi:phosphoheptose isomerase
LNQNIIKQIDDSLQYNSTSGDSANIYRGLRKVKEKGALAVGLLGNNGGQCLAVCNIAILTPGNDTPRIQEAHALIFHIICDFVEIDIHQESCLFESGVTNT